MADAATDPRTEAVAGAHRRLVQLTEQLVADHNRDVGIGATSIDVKSTVAPPPPRAGCSVFVLVLRPNADARRAGDVLSPAQVRDLENIARDVGVACTFTAMALETLPMRGMSSELHKRLASAAIDVAIAAQPNCVVILDERTAEIVYAGCGWGDPPVTGVLERPKKGTLAVATVPSIEIYRDPTQSAEARRVWEIILAQPRQQTKRTFFAAALGDADRPTKKTKKLTES